MRAFLERLARNHRFGHGQLLLVAQFLLVVFLDRPCRIGHVDGATWLVQACDVGDPPAQLVPYLLGLSLQRGLIFNFPIGEDHGQRSNRIAGRILQHDLGFDTRALRIDCGMRGAGLDHFEIACVRRLADPPDIGCNDRIVGTALRRLGVQDHDLHFGMPRQGIVDQKLRIDAFRHLRVELSRVEQTGLIQNPPAQFVPDADRLLDERIFIQAGDVRESHFDRSNRSPIDVEQLDLGLDVLIAAPVDFHARRTRLEYLDIITIRLMAAARGIFGSDDHALSTAWRRRVQVELEQIGMPSRRRIHQILGVEIAWSRRGRGLRRQRERDGGRQKNDC